MMSAGRTLAGLTALTAMLAAGCTSGSAPPAPTPTPSAISGTARPGTATDWPAYHGNAQRTGAVAGLPAAGPLSVAWSRPLSGEVAGQPLVIGDTVVAATEADTVFGLSRSTGQIIWRTAVGQPLPLADQPCGNLDPLGITGTPV